MVKFEKWHAAIAVISLGIVSLTILLAFGPPEARALVEQAGAWLAAVFGPLLTAFLTRDSDGDGTPDILDKTPIFPLAFAALILAFGCGGAQGALSAQARVVVETQPARFAVYDAMHAGCLESESDFEGYRECMRPSRYTARAVDSYASALEAAQAAYNLRGAEGLQGHLPCLVQAAQHALESLADANVPIPDEMREIAALVPGGECGGHDE